MTLTADQIKELKGQLKSQVSNLPKDQKAEALKQIEDMSDEALETMLEQQKAQAPPKGQKTIFRMIVDKEVDSVFIDESSDAVAVLDINPISRGHIIIIPKSAVSEPKQIPKEVFELAKKVTEKLMLSLKTKSVKLHTETKFGESYINLIPIYDKDLDINSSRSKSQKSDLEKLKKEINIERIEKKVEKIQVKKTKSKTLKLDRKIP